MTLQLVRLSVDLAALALAAGDRGWTSGRFEVFDEGVALHHLLGETFGAAVLQPFRLSVAPRSKRATLYAYTTAGVDELSDIAAATAMPEVIAALSPSDMQSKPMPIDWSEGRRLGFDVRVHPTVRLGSDIPPQDGASGKRSSKGFKRGAEIDAFLAEALRHASDDVMISSGRTREVVYGEWLTRRTVRFAILETVRLVSFRRARFSRNGVVHEGPDVVLQGTLKIANSSEFHKGLCEGLGRHKAYGFGMLLLRPPAKKP